MSAVHIGLQRKPRMQTRKAEDRMQALTRSYGSLLQERITSDPDFGKALLCEGVDALVAGDVDTAAAILGKFTCAVTQEPVIDLRCPQMSGQSQFFEGISMPQLRNSC